MNFAQNLALTRNALLAVIPFTEKRNLPALIADYQSSPALAINLILYARPMTPQTKRSCSGRSLRGGCLRRDGIRARIAAMPETPDAPQSSAPNVSVTAFNPELVFQVLSDATRRHILCQLASGATLGATELAVGSGRSANLVNKHLLLMRESGLVTTVESPVRGDRRRSLFALVPALRPADPAKRELDFGCCVLRLARMGHRR